MGLGRTIVEELRLDTRGETLQRWLAHHLAELIANADGATEAKKVQAEKKAVELILKLWAHRRSLPEIADPLGDLRNAIRALSYLLPPPNPWARYPSSDSDEGLLGEMFRTMSEAVLVGIVLTQVSRLRPVSNVESEFLEEEEKALRDAFERWLPIANPPQPPPPVVRIVVNGEPESSQEDSPEEPLDWDSLSPERQMEQATRVGKNRIVSQLEQMQTQIGTLLDRWRNNNASEGADV